LARNPIEGRKYRNLQSFGKTSRIWLMSVAERIRPLLDENRPSKPPERLKNRVVLTQRLMKASLVLRKPFSSDEADFYAQEALGCLSEIKKIISQNKPGVVETRLIEAGLRTPQELKLRPRRMALLVLYDQGEIKMSLLKITKDNHAQSFLLGKQAGTSAEMTFPLPQEDVAEEISLSSFGRAILPLSQGANRV